VPRSLQTAPGGKQPAPFAPRFPAAVGGGKTAVGLGKSAAAEEEDEDEDEDEDEEEGEAANDEEEPDTGGTEPEPQANGDPAPNGFEGAGRADEPMEEEQGQEEGQELPGVGDMSDDD
jgi:hypothetical protein